MLRPLDLEDVMSATPSLDVGTSLSYVVTRPEFPALRDAFRDGYSAVRPWVEHAPGDVERLCFPRRLDLLNIVAGMSGRRGDVASARGDGGRPGPNPRLTYGIAGSHQLSSTSSVPSAMTGEATPRTAATTPRAKRESLRPAHSASSSTTNGTT
ncbi:MAG: hypothetical protein ACI8PZ_004455 [Myxococcota bacterium]